MLIVISVVWHIGAMCEIELLLQLISTMEKENDLCIDVQHKQ